MLNVSVPINSFAPILGGGREQIFNLPQAARPEATCHAARQEEGQKQRGVARSKIQPSMKEILALLALRQLTHYSNWRQVSQFIAILP